MKNELNLSNNKLLYIYTDGASRGNPGPSACAYLLTEEGKKIIYSESNFIGKTTNNRAEYTAVIKSLKTAKNHYNGMVIIHSDSELLIKQAKGKYKVNNRHLKKLYDKMMKLTTNFSHVEFKHVPRENKLIQKADKLCNQKLDQTI